MKILFVLVAVLFASTQAIRKIQVTACVQQQCEPLLKEKYGSPEQDPNFDSNKVADEAEEYNECLMKESFMPNSPCYRYDVYGDDLSPEKFRECQMKCGQNIENFFLKQALYCKCQVCGNVNCGGSETFDSSNTGGSSNPNTGGNPFDGIPDGFKDIVDGFLDWFP